MASADVRDHLGLGQARLEHTLTDRHYGRIVTPNLSGYLVPVHANVRRDRVPAQTGPSLRAAYPPR